MQALKNTAESNSKSRNYVMEKVREVRTPNPDEDVSPPLLRRAHHQTPSERSPDPLASRTAVHFTPTFNYPCTLPSTPPRCDRTHIRQPERARQLRTVIYI